MTTAQGEHVVEVRAQRGEAPPYAFLAEVGERPQHGPADADGPGAEGEGCRDVAAPAHPAVHEDRHPSGDGFGHCGQRLHRCGSGIELPPSVVGYEQCVDALLDGGARVLGVQYTLEDERQVGLFTQSAQVVPATTTW